MNRHQRHSYEWGEKGHKAFDLMKSRATGRGRKYSKVSKVLSSKLHYRCVNDDRE